MSGKTFLGIVCYFGAGAWPPMLALSLALRERGHRVVLVCDERTKPQIDEAGIEAIIVPAATDVSEYFKQEHLKSWAEMAGSGQSLDDIPNPFVQFAKNSVPHVRDAARSVGADAIFSSLFTPSLAELIAEDLGIPWAYVNPAYAFGPGSPRPVEEDFAGPVMFKFFNDWLPEVSNSADIVIHGTDREYDTATSEFPSNHFQPGPLNLTSDDPTPDYLLEDGPEWALVSVSLIPQPEELEIVRFAVESLADEDIRVLVTAPQRDDQFERMPANVLVVDRAPHDAVLERSKLLVSHSGHGVVMRALAHGVPMVLVPWGRDQPGVAWRAEQLGVAAVVDRENLSQQSMSDAVKRVLSNDDYRIKASEVSARMTQEDPMSRACELLERLVVA